MDKKDYREICEKLVQAYMQQNGCREIVARGIVGEILERNVETIISAVRVQTPTVA